MSGTDSERALGKSFQISVLGRSCKPSIHVGPLLQPISLLSFTSFDSFHPSQIKWNTLNSGTLLLKLNQTYFFAVKNSHKKVVYCSMLKRLCTELLFYCIKASLWRSDRIWVISLVCGDKNRPAEELYRFPLYRKTNNFQAFMPGFQGK